MPAPTGGAGGKRKGKDAAPQPAAAAAAAAPAAADSSEEDDGFLALEPPAKRRKLDAGSALTPSPALPPQAAGAVSLGLPDVFVNGIVSLLAASAGGSGSSSSKAKGAGAPAVDIVSSLQAVAGQPPLTEQPPSSSSSSSASSAPRRRPRPFVQLSRLTLIPTDYRSAVADLQPRSPVLASYDLVALQPPDVETLRHVISGPGAGCVDIIRLETGAGGRLPVPLSPDLIEAAAAAGLAWEVEYSPAIRDAGCRRAFVQHVGALLRASRGGRRGAILVTSSAETPLELRTPSDVAALVSGLTGWGKDGVLDGLSRVPRSLTLPHAEARLLSRPPGSATLPPGAGAGGAAAPAVTTTVIGAGMGLVHRVTIGTGSGGGDDQRKQALAVAVKPAPVAAKVAASGAVGAPAAAVDPFANVPVCPPWLTTLAARGASVTREGWTPAGAPAVTPATVASPAAAAGGKGKGK